MIRLTGAVKAGSQKVKGAVYRASNIMRARASACRYRWHKLFEGKGRSVDCGIGLYAIDDLLFGLLLEHQSPSRRAFSLQDDDTKLLDVNEEATCSSLGLFYRLRATILLRYNSKRLSPPFNLRAVRLASPSMPASSSLGRSNRQFVSRRTGIVLVFAVCVRARLEIASSRQMRNTAYGCVERGAYRGYDEDDKASGTSTVSPCSAPFRSRHKGPTRRDDVVLFSIFGPWLGTLFRTRWSRLHAAIRAFAHWVVSMLERSKGGSSKFRTLHLHGKAHRFHAC